MTRHLGYAVSGLVAALALAACTGGSDDPPTTSTKTSSAPSTTSKASSPSTSATTGPSSTATVAVPPEARAHTPAGAEAFVKYFMEEANRSWVKPDVTVLKLLSDPGCISCKQIQDTASALAAKGHHYSANPVTVRTVAAYNGAPAGQQFVRLLMTQHKVDVVDSAGKVISTDPQVELARSAAVVWKGDSWLMYGIAE